MLTATRTDEQIQQDVLAELKWDARVHPNEIGVAVRDGVVTLTGQVDAYARRWAAQDVAHRVKGVTAVANEIEVRPPGTAERSDTDIAEAVAHALVWDAFVPAHRIDVTVSKGWVTLRGEVDWHYQKSDAERVVRRLAGVRGVSNLVTLKPTVTVAEVKEKIENALIRSAEIDADRIRVQVDHGKVVLKGKVRSFAEKQDAERAVWSAPGITAVENHLVIAE